MIHIRKIYVNSGKYAFVEEAFVPCVKSAFLAAQTEHDKPIHQMWLTSQLYDHADKETT
jgi:hypothetical protein